MNIDKIITESINEHILIKENTQQILFAQLEYCANELRRYWNGIKQRNVSSITDRTTRSFIIHEFYHFAIALEKAIRRCVSSRNINEYFSLSQLGPQDADLGIFNGVFDAFKRGYYGTYNFLTGGRRYGNRGIGSRYSNTRNINVNYNEKLIYLLSNTYPQIKNKYQRLNNSNAISSVVPEIMNAMNLIERNLIPTVRNIRSTP